MVEINHAEPEECPYCGSKRLFYSHDRGEIACTECGSVVAINRLDRSRPDWRAFTTEERNKRMRAGVPTNPALSIPSSISSTIDWSGRDAFGKKLDAKQRFDLVRLRKWNKVTLSSSMERNLALAQELIERFASQMNLPTNVKNEAFLIYKQLVNKNLVKGRSVKSMTVASLYAACRRFKIPITLDELVKNTKVNRKVLSRCFRIVILNANIKVDIVDPLSFVEKLIHDFKISPIVYSTAKDIVMKARERGLTSGKDPAGLASAIIYIATTLHNEKITQRKIAKVASISEITLRNRFREIIENVNISGVPLTLK